MSELENVRLLFNLPYTVWAYYSNSAGEVFCPLGNQPSQPFTTHIFWDAINKLESLMETERLTGIENPPRMPGNYLVCFRNKELAERFRRFTGIPQRWKTTKCYTEQLLRTAIGNVPFVVFVNDYVGEDTERERGFRWRVCHLVKVDKGWAEGASDNLPPEQGTPEPKY